MYSTNASADGLPLHLQVLLVQPAEPENTDNSEVSQHGVTPAAHDAVNRLFLKPLTVDSTTVTATEADLLTVLGVSGNALKIGVRVIGNGTHSTRETPRREARRRVWSLST